MQTNDIRKTWLYNHRHKHLSLDDIYHISKTYYGDTKLFHLFDMEPDVFYKKGIRILGRTAIECCIDAQASEIAKKAYDIYYTLFSHPPIVIDLFTGSGNLLYHISKTLKAQQTIGFENDKSIYFLTHENFQKIDFKCDLYHENCQSGIKNLLLPDDVPILFIVAPPWGAAFDHDKGLNLLLTDPPVDHIISYLKTIYKNRKLVFAIQIHEKMCTTSMSDIKKLFNFHHIFLTHSLKEGLNVGFLMGTTKDKQL